MNFSQINYFLGLFMKELTKLFTVAVGITILSTFIMTRAYAAPFPIKAEDQNQVVGVRLNDFKKYAKTHIPKFQEVIELMEGNPERFFSVPNVELHGMFFRDYPQINGSIITLEVDAMIAHKEYFKLFSDIGWEREIHLTELELEEKALRFRDVSFQRVTITYDSASGVLNPVSTLNSSIDLKDTEFEVNVAMLDRRVLMTDKNSDLRFIFPTGVGSVDNKTEYNDVRLLTPIYKDSFLDKKRAIYAREKPKYFLGKPFIRITTKEDVSKGHTAIGFHIDQNNGRLVRGFVSHGCLRLRAIDLYMMYDIVRFGTPQRISVNTRYRIENDRGDHPYPRKDSSYSRLKKYDKLKNGVYYRRCKFCRDKLMKTEWAGSPNLGSLLEQMLDTDDNGERPDGFYLWRLDSEGNRIDMDGRKVDKYGFPVDKKGRRIEGDDPEALDNSL
ncbi:MAG: hypothetical protein ACJAT2_001932 [Bacteriovoracaceae bacterium]